MRVTRRTGNGGANHRPALRGSQKTRQIIDLWLQPDDCLIGQPDDSRCGWKAATQLQRELSFTHPLLSVPKPRSRLHPALVGLANLLERTLSRRHGDKTANQYGKK